MAIFHLHGRRYDIEAVVFDKDGTLIDFHRLWGQRARTAVDALVTRVRGSAALRQALYQGIGYDPLTNWPAGGGPLAITTNAKLNTVATTVLYQHGLNWPEAERYVEESFASCMSAPPERETIRPLGNLETLFRTLHHHGLRLALATSDEGHITGAILDMLGWTEVFTLCVHGDDPRPDKPAPDGLWHIASSLELAPRQLMMVGDTGSDMLFATAAGAGCRVGVLSGAGQRADLEDHADVILDSVLDLLDALEGNNASRSTQR